VKELGRIEQSTAQLGSRQRMRKLNKVGGKIVYAGVDGAIAVRAENIR